jgi:hypothetical protein
LRNDPYSDLSHDTFYENVTKMIKQFKWGMSVCKTGN